MVTFSPKQVPVIRSLFTINYCQNDLKCTNIKNQVSYLSSGGGRNFFFVDVSGSLSAGGGGSRSKFVAAGGGK